MIAPRVYMYRKAGREVWDAEMWLPDGRRRVWRTGIADRADAEQAARARLEALAAIQTAEHGERECLADNAPTVSLGAGVPDAAILPAQQASAASAAMDAEGSAGERPPAQEACDEASLALASETWHFSRKLCPRSVFLGFESGLKHDVQRVEGLCDGC
jgi:hypothetical protein